MGRLEGKTAIITGTAQGLGLSVLQLFAEEGANIIAVDIEYDALKEEVEKIKDIDGEIFPVEGDVSSEEDWQHVVEVTLKKFDKIDILVNNAAILFKGQDIMNTDLDDWNQVVAVNQTGTMLGMQAVIPEMKNNGNGSIVNISSLAGLLGGFADNFNAAYSATKGAIRTLTKHAAQAHAGDNIRVNSVHPGVMKTDMFYENHTDEELELIEEKFPLPPHAVDPKYMAYGILYLASDESKFNTGTELVIDGGFTSR